ncbi:MAG: arginine--tRNA ligase, partial [bacterium]|nr:arginine--tRNA ligase [bacterium]
KQVIQVLKLMEQEIAERMVHVPFGLIKLPEGRMSSRQGKTIFLEEVFNKSIELVAEVIAAKNPLLAQRDDVARQVGIGAIVFGDLKNGRVKDVTFDWEDVLNFDGETGPYLQYTHARANAVLQKVGAVDWSYLEPSALTDEYALPLIKHIGGFPQEVEKAAELYEPSIISRYLLDLAQAFNRFYHHSRIIGQEEAVTNTRVAIVMATVTVLRTGLHLIGLEAPLEM